MIPIQEEAGDRESEPTADGMAPLLKDLQARCAATPSGCARRLVQCSHYVLTGNRSARERHWGVMRPLLLGLVPLLSCLACDARDAGENTGGPAGVGWAGTMDTLPNGAVLVSNPETGIWGETASWRLVEELRIGSAEAAGPELFGEIADLAIDDYGRIYVLDSQARQIRVFGADGRHMRTFGRRGSGPGEFERPTGMAWDGDRRLWVVDARNARYAVFDTAGSYQTGELRLLSGWMLPWPGTFDRSGRLLDFAFVGRESVLVRFDAAFAEADTFALPAYEGESYLITRPDGTRVMQMPVPFAPTLTWRLDPRGYLWFGVTAPYRIVQSTLSGDTVRIVDREYTPSPVSAEDRAAAIARLERLAQGTRLDLSRMPDERPAFQKILLDPDGGLWVVPGIGDEAESRLFDVFDPEGRYLGRVQSDVDLALYPEPVITQDAVYAVTRDAQDVPYVVRARIVRSNESPRARARIERAAGPGAMDSADLQRDARH